MGVIQMKKLIITEQLSVEEGVFLMNFHTNFVIWVPISDVKGECGIDCWTSWLCQTWRRKGLEIKSGSVGPEVQPKNKHDNSNN